MKWKVPRLGLYKVDFGGTLFKDIRNYIGALSQKIPWIPDVDCFEVRAALRAVQFALELGIQDVHLEGDSAIVISAISGSEFYFAPFEHITQEVVLLLMCRSSCVSYMGDKGNRVVHGLDGCKAC